MIDGVIEGGWGFVWAAYLITAATLIGYTISLWIRDPGDDDHSESTPIEEDV